MDSRPSLPKTTLARAHYTGDSSPFALGQPTMSFAHLHHANQSHAAKVGLFKAVGVAFTAAVRGGQDTQINWVRPDWLNRKAAIQTMKALLPGGQ